MKDILGNALKDYFYGNNPDTLFTETSISEEDELPLPYLFRSFEEMPLLEQTALKNCRGKILDIGCGAGSHALWLQQEGKKVWAIDISEGAVEIAQQRGVANVRQLDIMAMEGEKYDTLLLLMNGTGIFGTLQQLPFYLNQLKKLLAEKGQILIDSSDLQYMYDTTEEGGIWVPRNHYYGELEFTMTYKGETSQKFPWLYLDAHLFKEIAEENGFTFEVLEVGVHFDYLAKLTLSTHTHP
ncbi:MAG: SAM-dependent methyltransferase [Flavobacteriaceae bacterium]|nr:SAM-dependent methyltransferase [Flavobacteriaceae bacterium]|tara:strand:+ start:13792 stop:14511 length:720 start_codon:yes stop_codon:yes gene_type:complete